MKENVTFSWELGDHLYVNGKFFGIITSYNPSTGTFTFRKVSIWERIIIWAKGLILKCRNWKEAKDGKNH